MTPLLKTLMLSIVIVTSIMAPSLAKVGTLSDLEGSGDFSPPTKYSSVIFDNPLRKLDDSFSLEKIAQKSAPLNYEDSFDANFSAPSLAKSGIESRIFNPIDLELYTKEAARAKAEQAEATKRAAYDAYITEYDSQLREKDAAHQAALTVPSYLQVLGGHVYSAGAYALNMADYAARSRPTAFFLTYVNIELLEEGIANIGYHTAAGLSFISSGGNLAAGYIPGYAVYYGIKGAFKVANYLPGFQAWLAYRYMDDTQTTITYTLNTAQEAAKKIAPVAQSVVSYIRSYWA